MIDQIQRRPHTLMVVEEFKHPQTHFTDRRYNLSKTSQTPTLHTLLHRHLPEISLLRDDGLKSAFMHYEHNKISVLSNCSRYCASTNNQSLGFRVQAHTSRDTH